MRMQGCKGHRKKCQSVMNVLVNILDNNLSAFKEAEIIAPLVFSETPKENGQSTIDNVDSKRFVTKISDVSYNFELEDSQCLVSGFLLSVSSVVPVKVSSLLSSCCGDEFSPGLSGKDV
ncbi:hypothetical protein DSO57_1009934 [Entomophthora muscae]|uniref:Uncharacterized protein n=1 Tax=Entomophthora muscae TaxID=34485 RepID=A0ACC2TH92_9FUNG|nr:hypothetical protein DSO57_1009934 [Entomophthora muscae]